jgi:hypothetical protein
MSKRWGIWRQKIRPLWEKSNAMGRGKQLMSQLHDYRLGNHSPGWLFSKKRWKLDHILADEGAVMLSKSMRQDFECIQILCSNDQFWEKMVFQMMTNVSLSGIWSVFFRINWEQLQEKPGNHANCFQKNWSEKSTNKRYFRSPCIQYKNDNFWGVGFEPQWVISKPTPPQQMIDFANVPFTILCTSFRKSSYISAKYLMGSAK